MRGWLLDTKVVSEPVRPRPDLRVTSWLLAIPRERTFISVLTLAELEKGIESLKPDDPRRVKLTAQRVAVERGFARRVLSLDDDIVRHWGRLAGQYRRAFGGEAHAFDALLATTASERRLYVATRTVRDMRGLGVIVFNPWADDPTAFPLSP